MEVHKKQANTNTSNVFSTDYSQDSKCPFESIDIKEEVKENLYEEIEYPISVSENSKDFKIENLDNLKVESGEDIDTTIPKISMTLKTENSAENEGNKDKEDRFDYKKYLRLNNDTLECVLCEYKTQVKAYFYKHAKTVHFDSAEAKFQCQECLFKTTAQHKLNRHIKMKHNPNITQYKCPLCNYQTSWKYVIKNHIESIHGDAGYKCPHCTHIAKWKTNLRKHISVKHSDKCEQKPPKTNNKRIKSQSDEVQVNKDCIGYTCIYCDHKTKWRGSMSKHVKMKHNANSKVHFCEHCPYSTKEKHSLVLHNRKRHENLPEKFQCPYCDFRSKAKCYVNQHIDRKHPENNQEMQCSYCSYKTRSRTYYRNHVNAVHLKKRNTEARSNSTATDLNTTVSNEDESLSLNYSGHSLFQFENMNVDENTLEEIEDPATIIRSVRENLEAEAMNVAENGRDNYETRTAENTREIDESCPIKDIKVEIDDLIMKDVDDIDDLVPDVPEYLTLDTLETKPAPEIILPKNPVPEQPKFDWKKFLKPNDGTTFECTACNYKTHLKRCFYRHAKAMHDDTAEPKFECQKCPFRTTAQFKLNRHIRAKHNDDSIFKCHHCNYNAKWKYKLLSHIKNVHSGEKGDFRCPHCDHVSNYKANLKRHILSKHESKKNTNLVEVKHEIIQSGSEEECTEMKSSFDSYLSEVKREIKSEHA